MAAARDTTMSTTVGLENSQSAVSAGKDGAGAGGGTDSRPGTQGTQGTGSSGSTNALGSREGLLQAILRYHSFCLEL